MLLRRLLELCEWADEKGIEGGVTYTGGETLFLDFFGSADFLSRVIEPEIKKFLPEQTTFCEPFSFRPVLGYRLSSPLIRLYMSNFQVHTRVDWETSLMKFRWHSDTIIEAGGSNVRIGYQAISINSSSHNIFIGPYIKTAP